MAKKAGKQKTTKKATTTNQKQKAKSRLALGAGVLRTLTTAFPI